MIPLAKPFAPLLEMRGISKRFPGVHALDGVDFDLHAGEVHVLLGENGAGKSTLMKILSGACARDGGTVTIDGTLRALASPREAQAAGIGTIYQEFNLVPHLTAAENILLGREPRRAGGIIDRPALRRRAASLLETIGSPIDPDARLSALTVAEQQMVEVAKALSIDARILIMDEPTSALTDAEIEQLFATIGRLTARGAGIIYISHRLEELSRIGDRATVLRDGRLIATRTLPTPVAELVSLMANRDVAHHYPPATRTRGEPILDVQDLARGPRLRGVSFTLHRGEILAVAGLLGAGRTELARAIAGADTAERGRILVRGQPMRPRTPAQAIRRGIGLVPEDRKRHGFVPAASVAGNIALPQLRRLGRLGRLGLVPRGRERRAGTEWIERLRIKTPAPTTAVATLSGGNQQKVVLAKWLATGADILIVDEPTRGIDVAARAEIYTLLDALAARGAAILMISSDLPEVLGMGDRVMVMHAGRVAAVFDRRDASAERVLHAALGLAAS